MISATVLFSVWTCIFAMLTSIFTISNNSYSRTLLKIFGNGHTSQVIVVFVYALTIVASAISLWEAWKATVMGSSTVFAG